MGSALGSIGSGATSGTIGLFYFLDETLIFVFYSDFYISGLSSNLS